MQSNFEKSLAMVLKSEGGFVNHPKDPGGMTNLGVTRLVWETWVKRRVTDDEMRALTPELVGPMYKKMYWDGVKGDELPKGLDYAMFDFAVNAGPWRATKILQAALDVTVDGMLGKKTLAAVEKADQKELLELFTLGKEAFYKTLDGFKTFGKGWMSRVVHVQQTAEGMLA
jgi:lysozyme family protein